MKKATKKLILAIAFIVLISAMLCFGVSAKTYGDYEYTIVSCEDCYDEYGDYIDGHVCEKTAVITGYKGKAASVKIPSKINGKKVSGVSDDAFYGYEKLKTVTLPDTISSLAYRAFGDCTSLESVNIPEKVKSIDPLAFDNCHKLKKISVSKDNEYFSSNKSGVIFNKDKTSYLMYPSGKQKTTITIPDGVKTIEEKAFYGFTNLAEVKLPSGLKKINSSAFYACTGLKTLKLPSSLKFLGYYCFSKCTALKSVTIPKNIEESYGCAFKDCTGLVSVKFASGAKYVFTSMFEDCTKLKKVTLPDSITTIDSSAFEGCVKLNEITIPKNVQYIYDDVFEDCASLKSISIPKKVEQVGSGAFTNCTSLETVKIANGVSYIGSSVFAGCTALKSITIPDSVTELGGSAFAGCTSLKSVKLSKKIETLYDGTFDNCTSLKSITIPDKLSYVHDNVFNNCAKLTEFKVSSKNKHFSADKYGVFFNKNKTTLIRYPEGNERKSYTIPKGVKKIVVTAFNGCFNLEKFAVSSGSKSFYADKNGVLLTKNKKELVRYPAGRKADSYTISSKVKTTADFAFYDCINLEEVKIPDGFKHIGYRAFENCTSLKSIKIPNNVESLVYLPRFTNCTSLKTISLPASLKSINGNQFTGCSSLEEVNVSSKNKNFSSDSDGVFYNRKKTELLIYPQGKTATAYAIREGVKFINYYAFYEDVNLKSIYIPKSIENLEDYYFANMKSLKDIYYPGSKSEWKKLFEWGFNVPGVKVNYNHKHSYKTVIAQEGTTEENGKIVSQCVCGKINSKKDPVTIYKVKSVKLSETKITYNGKVKIPSVTIKDSKGKVLKKNKDYTLKYSEGRIKPGKYTVTVTFKGNYSGTAKLTFTIVPAKVTLSKVTSGSKSAVVAWKKHSGVTGYEVTYSTSSKFNSVKKATISGASKKKMTIKKLSKGKKYYFKVRAYKSVSGTKVYGPYSSIKSVKIK